MMRQWEPRQVGREDGIAGADLDGEDGDGEDGGPATREEEETEDEAAAPGEETDAADLAERVEGSERGFDVDTEGELFGE